jgi:hypothetical protein
MGRCVGVRPLRSSPLEALTFYVMGCPYGTDVARQSGFPTSTRIVGRWRRRSDIVRLDSREKHELKAPFLTGEPRCGLLVYLLLSLKYDFSRYPPARILPWEIAVAALLRSLLSLRLGLR